MEFTLSLYWVKGACILHCPDGFSFDTKELWAFFKGFRRRKANVPVNNRLIDSTSAISSLRVGQLQGARSLFINFDTCSSSTAEKRDKLFLVRYHLLLHFHIHEACFGRLRHFSLEETFQSTMLTRAHPISFNTTLDFWLKLNHLEELST